MAFSGTILKLVAVYFINVHSDVHLGF